VNGISVEPGLCPCQYRALAKMIRAFIGGSVGIPHWPEGEADTRECLGHDQGDLSRLRTQNPEPWKDIIFTPRRAAPVA
jgi:hypothetical protein